MNPTTTSRSKSKFSSRNLNVVFKAPRGAKPLPANATGPLQRPTSHMLVLGRAAVAPPAPINTRSLKSERHVHDVRVSLVPAGSTWAKNAEKGLERDAPDHLPDAANVAASTAVSETMWTPQRVAERLHTCGGAVRPQVTVANSGRWGDDAVDDDIVQNTIRRRLEKEMEFPDLKQALEVTTQPCHGHSSVTSETRSMDSLQEPEQRHGRATGRWAHFNKEETTGSQWHYGQNGRDEDDRWSRGQLRYDTDYGLESRQHEAKSNAVLSESIECRARFSRSDVRFDIVASRDGDRALNCSPHCMDWGSALLSRRGASLPSVSPTENSCLQPSRSSSPPLAGSIAVDLAPGREDHGCNRARENRQRTNTEWPKSEELSTCVAEETQSLTESSSNSLSHSSPSTPQQVQVPKRPKMLFDPKTGGILNAEDMMRLDKRQTGGRKDRNAASTSKSSGSVRASKRTDGKPEEQANVSASKSKHVRARRKEAKLTPDVIDAGSNASQLVVVAIAQESVDKGTACTIETSSTTSSNAAKLAAGEAVSKVASSGRRVNRDSKRVTAKQPPRQESKSGVTKLLQDACPSISQTTRSKQQHRKARHTTVRDVRGSSTPSSGNAAAGIKSNTMTQCNGRGKEGNKLAQHGINAQEVDTQKPMMNAAETALLTPTADDGLSSGVVVLTDAQQGIEINPEDDGFETVKSRRVVLFEKKQIREQVIATATLAPLLDEKKHERAPLEEHVDVESKEVQVAIDMAGKVGKVGTQSAFKSHRKAAKLHRNANEVVRNDKDLKRASEQATRTRGRKKVPATAKIAVGTSSTDLPEPMTLRPIKQVIGEAPVESLRLEKNAKEVSVQPRKDGPKDEARSYLTCNDGTGLTRKPKESKQQGANRSPCRGVPSEGSAATKSRPSGGTTAKARSKPKVRQVYVVKTLAPAPASATITGT